MMRYLLLLASLLFSAPAFWVQKSIGTNPVAPFTLSRLDTTIDGQIHDTADTLRKYTRDRIHDTSLVLRQRLADSSTTLRLALTDPAEVRVIVHDTSLSIRAAIPTGGPWLPLAAGPGSPLTGDLYGTRAVLTTTADAPISIVHNLAGGFTRPFQAFNSGMVAGNQYNFDFGQSASTNNAANFGFKYVGAGLSTNYVTLGMYGANDLLTAAADGTTRFSGGRWSTSLGGPMLHASGVAIPSSANFALAWAADGSGAQLNGTSSALMSVGGVPVVTASSTGAIINGALQVSGLSTGFVHAGSTGILSSSALLASEVPALDASKITTGALPDARIASAATWNAKVGGSGTTNTIPKFTGSSALGNSLLTDDGSSVASSGNLRIVGGGKSFVMRNTGATTNEKVWSWFQIGGDLSLYAFDDAEATGQGAFGFSRTAGIPNRMWTGSAVNVDVGSLSAGGITKAAPTTGRLSIATAGTDYVIPSGSITGNAATATKWATARNITIGSSTQAIDGASDKTFTLAAIGAQAAFTTLPASAFPALTGDVTTVAGSLATTAHNIDITEHSENNQGYPVVWDNGARSLFHTASKLRYNPALGLLTATTAQVGQWYANEFYARFGHSSYNNVTGFGYLQSPSGEVYLESPSGAKINLRVNGTPVVELAGTAVTLPRLTGATTRLATVNAAGQIGATAWASDGPWLPLAGGTVAGSTTFSGAYLSVENQIIMATNARFKTPLLNIYNNYIEALGLTHFAGAPGFQFDSDVPIGIYGQATIKGSAGYLAFDADAKFYPKRIHITAATYTLPVVAAGETILLTFDVSACQMSTNSTQSVTWRAAGGANSFAAASTTNFDSFGYGTGTRIASAWLTGITSTRVDIRG